MMEQAFSRPRRKHGRIAVVSMAGLFGILVAILLIPVSLAGAGVTGWIVFCIVLSVLWRLQFVRPNKIKNKIVITGQIRELKYEKHDEKTGKDTIREDTYFRVVDFNKYLDEKGNHNIAIVGMAGSGKTLLTYFIINEMKNYKKIIFQYKEKDRFVEMGTPTLYLSKYAPNVFANPDIFAHAWSVAFQGEATTYKTIPDIVKALCEKSHNWNEFKKAIDEEIGKAEKSDIITKGALNAIKRQTERLYMEHTADYDLPENIVISFEGMDDRAFVFYAEFLLSQLYKEIKSPKREGTMIFIDEASRFTGTTTLLPEIAEEIRATGALLVSTQRVSRIAGDIKGNCALQVCFKQTEGEDIEQIQKIYEPYRWGISELHQFEFLDLAQSEAHRQIYTFSLKNPHIDWKPIIEWKPIMENKSQDSKGEGSKTKQNIDYPKEIILSLEHAKNVQGIARALAKKFRNSEEKEDIAFYKQKIFKIVSKMAVNELIIAERTDNVKFNGERGQETQEIVYCRKGNNPSDYHEYLVNSCADILYHKNIVPKIQPSGIGTADIEAEKYVFECETGLKNAINDIEGRIKQYKKLGRETLIIVPNQEAKKKYSERYPDVKVLTLPELWEAEL
ncbi:ATP-binding protein [Cuniculiplasma divulgatum]|jgi:hypothetical protein|uniref:Predicted membrane bound DEAD/DEAH box helicase n=1 Tax=Cuniculiplasma divulgatum TaxID=1673428 RepID=A0A1R4A6A5_9ARCH|nr:ATP-binding protein [Cuniculiplasma divulgatum]MCI2412792.1 ATP-binding protein [Cuniculiplasma sp.]SJK84449.1 predicted membrane bound DEAD/DEAH box helicase [Cuniculiplasma divulgatum]